MKVGHYDRKTGELKVMPDTLDDLWHLSKVLSPGSRVEAHSFRTYKVGTREEKKSVFITITAERIEFSKTLNRLRILGTITAGNPEEFVQLGRHHTIEVEPCSKIKITRQWKKYELDRLRNAETESKKPKIRIIVLDDEKALTAIVRSYGVEYGPELYSHASKRDERHAEAERSYLGEVAAEIGHHQEKYVVAGPGFTKDNLRKFIQQKNPALLQRIAWESCSSAERPGVSELMKKGVLERIAGEERIEQETKLIEELIVEIHKGSGRAAYGIMNVQQAVEALAVKQLLVLDDYLRSEEEAERLVEAADKTKAKITILSSEEEPGMKLKGLGKIAALLKFRI